MKQYFKLSNKNKKSSKSTKFVISLSINITYNPIDINKMKILKKYLDNNNQLLLSDEEYNNAYTTIKEKITKNKVPVASPIAITLGGQPGSGKSTLYPIAQKRFSNNIVEIDCDNFRVYHPYAKQIHYIFGEEDSLKTNPFVFNLVDKLIEELSEKKYNLIIESSLNSPNSALDNGKNLNPKGYKVELQVMATPKQISWQGTIDRYNEQIKNGKIPRAIKREYHDMVIQNICESLQTVKNSGLMSNILIYNRNKICIYDMSKNGDIEPSELLYSIINDY